MRRMICVRNCHGFRGGYWNKGEIIDVADGEDIPRHFVGAEEYENFLESENKPKPRNDIMNPSPQTHPIPIHLQGKGGMSGSPKTAAGPASGIQKRAPVSAPRPGSDI